MKNILLITFLSVFLISAFSVNAQNEKHVHENEHIHHVGIGLATSKLSESKELKPGFHIHYLRQIGESEHWSMGIGYEGVLTDQAHNSINFLMNYRPMHMISLNAGPGLVFGKHEGEFEIKPAFHTEAVLEFEINNLHFGPLAGFGIDKEDSHFSFGVHVGIGF